MIKNIRHNILKKMSQLLTVHSRGRIASIVTNPTGRLFRVAENLKGSISAPTHRKLGRGNIQVSSEQLEVRQLLTAAPSPAVYHNDGTLQIDLDRNGETDIDRTVHQHGDYILSGNWSGKQSTLAVVRPEADGRLHWYADLPHRTAPLHVRYGNAGDIPVVGDWNGNGRDTIGVVRDEGGRYVWLLNNFDGKPVRVAFGKTGDEPVVGDWNGDGVDDPGFVRRVGDRMLWFLSRNAEKLHPRSFYAGKASDVPVVGDWNGDGTDNIGITRSMRNGKLAWFVDTSKAGATRLKPERFQFGHAGDTPIVGHWRLPEINVNGVDDTSSIPGVSFARHQNELTISIENTGTATLRVSDIQLPPGLILRGNQNLTIPAGRSTNILVKRDTEIAGAGVIQLSSNDGSERQVEIPVNWQTREPNIEITGSRSFGTNSVGQRPVEKTFVVRNTGDAVLYLSQPYLSFGKNFDIVRGVPTDVITNGLQPNGVISFTVRALTHESSTPYYHSDYIRIASNDPDEGLKTLRVYSHIRNSRILVSFASESSILNLEMQTRPALTGTVTESAARQASPVTAASFGKRTVSGFDESGKVKPRHVESESAPVEALDTIFINANSSIFENLVGRI